MEACQHRIVIRFRGSVEGCAYRRASDVVCFIYVCIVHIRIQSAVFEGASGCGAHMLEADKKVGKR